MKLKGSKTEEEYRQLLTKSNEDFFSNSKYYPIIDELKKEVHNTFSAYIIDWIPEQEEELFDILISENCILKVLLKHDEGVAVITDALTLSQYCKGLSQRYRIKLAVALDLLKNHDQ
ncbi:MULTISPECIES: hypothetical protein [Paenibacillus]|jgi:hypothetical protein|uniref:hypothetical protein n=1 Tax=Paenibacillus TaxID=44249 RepID=UPI00096D6735|nr:hypothetical protein [Paenibacillus odorifer]OMD48829.1 hypothetical protein BSK55_29040 [Paenibacillus odorifer]